MADRLDVAERLAEGRPAVERTETYVRACHTLGYQHPDLTAHPAQLRDWYDGEDGLDLRALDRDCAQLRAAGAAVVEALRLQRTQLAELTAAWAGPGGDAAVRFLEGQCDAANAVATEVRAAAQRCESLRDNLWYLVDSKVATAVAIDDRTRAQRPAWLEAAAAVTTGAGDRPSAEEVVRQQVIPYVDNEIRDDWLTTMRSTADGVDTAYDMVIDRMAAAPAARFEVPGDLGPGYRPLAPADTTPAAPVSPAAAPGPPADPVAAPAPPALDPATAAPVAPAAMPAAPLADPGTGAIPAGGAGGGLGGLGGLASRIVDALGSLLDSASDPLDTDDAFDDDDPFDDDVEDKPGEDKDKDKNEDKDQDKDQDKDVDEARDSAEEKAADEPRPVAAPPPPAPVGAAAPVAAPAPAAPPPAPAATGGSTPCEIAADQLPQAGQ